jgi:ABC-type ATPase involved in cell division
MPLLAFEHVAKSYPDGRRRLVVLEHASFDVHAGDFVGILGPQRAGKSTLLRLAAGIESPDSGTVSFDGRDMARMSTLQRNRLLRTQIGVLATDDWRPGKGELVVDLVALPLVSDGASLHEARCGARKMLHWAGAARYADELAQALSVGERTRAMLARALVREPRLLLVDEPAVTPSPTERNELHQLLRSASGEHGVALIVVSQDYTFVQGATVAMTLEYGELCSTEPGVVLPFPPRQRSDDGLERSGS